MSKDLALNTQAGSAQRSLLDREERRVDVRALSQEQVQMLTQEDQLSVAQKNIVKATPETRHPISIQGSINQGTVTRHELSYHLDEYSQNKHY